MSARGLPDEARDLFALPPEDFVAARDRLAAELKDAGRPEEAAGVKKLRRPSIVAWAVNVASRERPEDVATLREAGQALRRAQRKALSGGGGEELRRATDERRALTQRLADAGVAAIGERGAAHRDAIAATLDAASVDDELGEQLGSGTLEREAHPTAGFGAIEGFEVLVGGGGAGEDHEAVEEDPAELRRERTREARAAAQRAAAAERAADKARARAEDLKAKATAAAAAAREAEAEARRLADEARTERKRADRAAKSAEAAGGRA